VIGHGRGEKLRIFKMRRRKNSRQRTGHRQNFTELEIVSIDGRSAEPATEHQAETKGEETPQAVAGERAEDLAVETAQPDPAVETEATAPQTGADAAADEPAGDKTS
jgi:hypothetical protein